jgi:hypothetical protein
VFVSQLAVTLWWMLLYPFSAAVGVAVGYLIYLLFLIVPAVAHAPKLGLFHLAGTLIGLLAAGGTFVRTAGRLAPEVPTGAASAACGIAIAASAFWVHRLSVVAAVTVVAPIAIGALAGVVTTYGRELKACLRAVEADQREAASPQEPA